MGPRCGSRPSVCGVVDVDYSSYSNVWILYLVFALSESHLGASVVDNQLHDTAMIAHDGEGYCCVRFA